ncbi:Tfp pilus assembly protein FimT/FimU [Methylotenera sp.]|uniref:pilus assembly FimT family protein n=1 Tax=Methylotenera sp. TaxID=2051956 RepID=UPI002728A940|nr:prepilin-type N-terminal cleavage/methylation domain-containing protein [Methylotenera sp.]MDO9394117.1 prepilin-type N-terminal cleavage/methylation domain-containing protein [Methylotenera sp.]MDP2071248.1 prepilin-type N-terminal cleavage/methylation domain-containing protein [Methylotenera sp.]MDP2231546.1 prepilin-type N-terminal cleavage/methylation domain-containing protein [Methylotenera sp.]MDP3005165.1 prepilin-type N-terminal cleavage/methylation domain-containing protein [Methylo
MKHQQTCSTQSCLTKFGSTQYGFTLVDLTVVMMILGIIAASALPGLIDLTNDARVATVNKLEGGFRSAVDLLQAGNIATRNDNPILPKGAEVSINDAKLIKSDGN